MPTSALHKIRPRRADFMDISNGSYEIIPIEVMISLGPMWASAPTGAQLNDKFSLNLASVYHRIQEMPNVALAT